MKVKLSADVNGPEGSWRAGATVDVSEKLALGLIAGGYAELVEDPKPVAEVAAIEPKETATKTKPKKRTTAPRKAKK